MKKVILLFISCFIISLSALAETSVWKVSKAGEVLFLGGTCHILRSSDYPLPPEFEKAYSESELLVFETDIGEMNTPETQQKMLNKLAYMDGTGLKDHLSPRVYKKLNSYCESNGIPLISLDSFKPVMALLTLVMLELRKIGITEKGVDMYFYELSLKDNKPVHELETINEQIDFIASVGAGNEDNLVLQTLDEISRTKENIEQIISHWKTGDNDETYRLNVEPVKNEFPRIYRTLFVVRNEVWLPKIETFMKTPEKEFILVGFAHLAGEDGLIEQLSKRGYKIEKF